MDGRDTLPTSGAGYLEQLQQQMREYGVGKLASVSAGATTRWIATGAGSGRAKAFDAMVNGPCGGRRVRRSACARLKESYNNGVTDEFIIPFACADAQGKPSAPIRDEDVCICFNYRADRARQITRVLAREQRARRTKDGRDLPGAESGRGDSAHAGAEESALRLHDAVRQEFHAAGRHSAGIDGQPAGEPDGAGESAQPARGGDGEVRARDVLLQWRNREAVSGRRSDSGAVAESCDLRSGAGDVAPPESPTLWSRR